MRLVLVLCFAALALGAAPVHAQIDTPEEWEGIWRITTLSRDCTLSVVFDETTEDVPLCPGAPLDLTGGQDAGLDCTGTVGPGGGQLVCTGEQAIPGFDCTAQYTAEIDVTVSGTSFSSAVEVTLTYVGSECNFGPDQCFNVTATGERIGPVTNECEGVPLDRLSWGAAKSRY